MRFTRLTAAAAVASVVVTVAFAAPSAQATSKVIIGSTGDSAQLSHLIKAPLADHAYGWFSHGVPSGRMISVRANSSWRAVAAARSGSALYNDIVRWATTIRSRSVVTLLAYHHEPEAASSRHYGSSTDYKNAYRHVVSIFRAQHVTNVVFVWQMTAYAFRVKPGAYNAAARWYPGSDVVNVVGADAYNWNGCQQGTQGAWKDFSKLGDPVVAFARANRKQAAFPEFGSVANGPRASWLQGVHTYLTKNRNYIAAAFYFQRAASAVGRCSMRLTSPADLKAFGDLARDTTVFST